MQSFNALRERQKKTATPYKIYTWLPVAINTIISLCRFDAVPLVEGAAAQMGVSFDEAARYVRTCIVALDVAIDGTWCAAHACPERPSHPLPGAPGYVRPRVSATGGMFISS